MPSALIVDDDAATRYALGLVLSREGFAVVEAASGEEGLAACARERPDVVFLDLAMPGMGGLDTLEALAADEESPPVVVITGVGTPDSTIRAVQLGAYEYLQKPLDAERVGMVARRATELCGLRRRLGALRHAGGEDEAPRLVGAHPSMQEVYKAIGRVTTTADRTTVLLLGETGTGKELVAREIHRAGRDAAAPFVVVNCAALPETLIESELFGHERGAFTGAVERRPGKVELAGDGTLFLDEIASLGPSLQQRFLRLLQEREFERVGGREVLRARARFVAASNRDIRADVGAGRFREDLYFRLSVFPIVLPPVRQRKSDLPLLVAEVIRRMNARLGRRVAGVSPGAMATIEAHDWPGNVREIENAIHHAMLRAAGDVIPEEALPAYLRPSRPADADAGSPFEKARRDALAQFERAYLARLLDECRGNVTHAAARAGMRRQSFQRLLRRHRLLAGAFREAAAASAPAEGSRGPLARLAGS